MPSSLRNSLIAKALRLPPPPSRLRVVHDADIAVSASDGAQLLTDTWYPEGAPEAPVVLIRTPYGRGGSEAFLGDFLARHGFRAMIQSCRGTAGSTGSFVPFVHEADDSLATVQWLREQPWFAGQLATYGVSFAGYTAWTLATHAPPELVAVVPVIAPMDPFDTLFPNESMAAEVLLTWSSLMPNLPSRLKVILRQRKLKRDVCSAALTMPPMSSYVKASGGIRKDFVESWFEHDRNDPFWRAIDVSNVLDTIAVPTLLVGGWHDIFTDSMVRQFGALSDRGVDTALLMSATTHSGHVRALGTILSHVLPWLHDAFAGRRPTEAGTITVQEVGTGAWLSLSQWPPAGTQAHSLYLQPDGALAAARPDASGGHGRFRYNPHDPTPSIGGELLSMSAREDNRPLQHRADVLTYATPVLSNELLLAGGSTVTLYWECDGASYDVFGRLLDVAPDGRSTTITDALTRVVTTKPGTPEKVVLQLPPTYCRLAAGHRLALLISAGAHPRYLRNHGTADRFTNVDAVIATNNTVYHNSAHPSSLELTVLGALADQLTPSQS